MNSVPNTERDKISSCCVTYTIIVIQNKTIIERDYGNHMKKWAISKSYWKPTEIWIIFGSTTDMKG